MRVPPELNAEQVVRDVHSHLQRACECDPKLADAWRLGRVRHQRGDEWICMYEAGFKSLRESNAIEVLRAVTQEYVHEAVMLSCYGVVGFGAYAHFVEGALVRFTAACEDWTEGTGTPEPWESDLIPHMRGLHEHTVAELGKRLGLRDVGDHSLVWDLDVGLLS